MSIRRVALIFDNRIRPDTTGAYCLRALKAIVDVEHFLPADVARIPREGFDLYLNIDDGLRYRLPADLHPCAWWAIDTHLDFPWYASKGQDFDFLFAAQRDGTACLRNEGLSAHWLPLACDPVVHRKHPVGKAFDICFIGHLFSGPRFQLVGQLQQRFPNTFVGQRYFEEMAATYSASRLVFNRSIRNDINMRVFEALACGSLLLTNDLRDNGQDQLFRGNEHMITYTTSDEMLDKAAYYLEHEDERERIAAAGQAEARQRHTYRHRLEALLEAAQRAPVQVPVCKGAEPVWVAPPLAAAATPENELSCREIMNHLPSSARRILVLGNDTEQLGNALKSRQHAEVVAIRLSDAEASLAGAASHVLVDDTGEFEFTFPVKPFDAVICMDGLQYLREPDQFLRRAQEWLVPDGCLIACIPNARYHRIVGSLLEGDSTNGTGAVTALVNRHLFTRCAVEGLLLDSGWSSLELEPIPGLGHDEWRHKGCPGEVRIGKHLLQGLSPRDAEEFFVERFLVIARMIREEHIPADAPLEYPERRSAQLTAVVA